MTVADKANSLASKINALTEKFNLSEELLVHGDELESKILEKTLNPTLNEISGELMDPQNSHDVDLFSSVDLSDMMSDFNYVRSSLRETTDNARKVLLSMSLDLLDEDLGGDEDGGSLAKSVLITSFAELNKAVSDNMKLYMQSYKDITSVLINLDKVRNPSTSGSSVTNNTVVLAESINTADLIKKLRKDK